MEASFVSRAKTAFHSAAAKAEKVFTDIKKSDPISDRGEYLDKQSSDKDESEVNNEVKNLKWRPAPIKTKHDWHGRFKNIKIGKRGVEDPEKTDNSGMAYAIFDENLYMMSEREFSQAKESNFYSPVEGSRYSNSNIIPPTAALKQLAVAIEAGKNLKSMRDLMASSRDSSPVRERASLSFSAMKSLVLRDKEDKLSSEFGNNEKVVSVIKSLLDAAEGQFSGWKNGSDLDPHINITSLPKDIHGAPPDSFVIKVSEAIGNLKTLRKMASFWFRIVAELRRLWSEELYVPGIPPDEVPDLNLCLLYQQLQLINCCISRKKRRSAATESLDSVLQDASNVEVSSVPEEASLAHSILFARISTGEVVTRLGADKQADNLAMLETGEPIYAPVLQEPPLLTEDLIKETEEFVLRTGSVGAGCSQLLSDMQAFKAANPGCILEDFVRWHSPPDWTGTDIADEVNETSDSGDSLSSRGQLSQRMQKEGNLWRELWETAKSVPAVQQTPLFDEDLAVEGILSLLEDVTPSELFEQLFVSLLGTGFVVAEPTLSTNLSLFKIFHDCRNYIISTCQGSNWVEKIDDICQVYETVETMLLNPDEVIRVTVQPEETPTGGDLRNHFKKISMIFSSKDRNSSKTPPSKDQKNTDAKTVRQSLASIFSKKPPKPSTTSPADSKPLNSVENDWTIV